MARLPYASIAPEANRLYQQMTSSPNLEKLRFWWEVYVDFLKAAGWTPLEFDQEAAKFIDEGWDEKPAVILN